MKGVLQIEKGGSYRFIINKGQMPTCSNCFEVITEGFACKLCNQLFCSKCVRSGKGCSCVILAGEQELFKCDVVEEDA